MDEPSSAGRGQVLAPWPNRLDGGRYAFDGRPGAAAIDEPELGNAIHGLVRWLPWRLASRTDEAVALECVLHPQPAYPWRLELGLEYRLGTDGLRSVARATNASAEAAPFGIGFHPYLTMGIPVDDVRLTIPASRRLITDDRALPVGEEDVAGTEFDFTRGRPVGATQLDTCFTGLARGSDGRSRARLESADGDRGDRGLGGRGVRLPPGVHGGHARACLPAPAGRRDRTDDVPAERVRVRRRRRSGSSRALRGPGRGGSRSAAA